MKTRETYDFDTVIDRHRTNSVKWDFCNCCFGVDDILPMWVADMDFKAPPAVVAAIEEAARHGIYGYSALPEGYFEAVVAWIAKRYNWTIRKEWLSYTPGVITGLNVAIQTFTRPGDKVVLQSPVYPPFFKSIENNGRRVLDNRLRYTGEGYEMDLELLESQMDEETKMIALCSPHNPVGRVWSREELQGLAEIVLKHDLLVFSDEIHADLVYSGADHISFASLSRELAERTITGIAPSKTFNIAGLKASVIITPRENLRREFDKAQERTFGLYNANTFAICAAEAAYREGEAWLEALMEYLEANRDYALQRLERELPEIQVAKPEGTFLLWLDCNRFGLSPEELYETVSCKGRVGLNDGRSFGAGGEGFLRLNIGCPRSVLTEGLDRLTGVLGPLREGAAVRR